MKRRRNKEYTYLIYCSLRKDGTNYHCNTTQVYRKPILTDKDLEEITKDLEGQLNVDREKHNIIIHSYQLMH
jgi:protein associated with RNAse G/E